MERDMLVDFFEGLARIYDAGSAAVLGDIRNTERLMESRKLRAMATEARAVVRSIEARHD